MARVRWVALLCGVAMACGAAAKCAAQPWTPPVSQQDKDIAAETGSNVGEYPNAILDGPAGTQDECSVAVRVMRAGSMTPIISGVKLTAVTLDEHGQLVPGGTLTVTVRAGGVWMIHDVPARFQVADSFTNGGGGRGWIRRR